MSTERTDSAKKSSSSHLNRQVGMYSLAAAAAGVSFLALVQPATGEVVVTKKTIPIPLATHGMLEPVKISMANNGIEDFGLRLTAFSGTSVFRSLGVYALAYGDGVLGGGFNPEAWALPRGAKIGANNTYATFTSVWTVVEKSGSNSFRGFYGNWGGNPKDHYLGVRFLLNGQTHYGWIRLTVTTDPQLHGPFMSAKITGYAYETVPNKPILAGTAGIASASTEKSSAEVEVPQSVEIQGGPSLGMLAAGADGLPLWRREESASAK